MATRLKNFLASFCYEDRTCNVFGLVEINFGHTLQNSLSDYRRLKPHLPTIYEGYPTVSDASYTARTRPRAGLGEKTINKPKRE